MEELDHIVTFARVVKAGSFSAAARHLKVTGSVASKHVAKLERALGVRLLNRNTRKLSLTEAGAAYYAHCERIVAEVETSRRALAELQAMPRGTLRVTAPVPLASTLGPMLREFLERFPKIQVELDASNRVVDLADEGFDLAIRFARTLPPNVVARPLRTIRLHVCAAPDYLKRAGTPRHPADLARHNCLSVPVAAPDGIWRFVRDGEHVEVPVHGSLQTNTVEALRDLALGGTGITVLAHEMIAKDLRDGRLAAVLDDWQIEPPVTLYAVYLPTPHLAPKVRVFVDFLVEKLAASARKPARATA